MARKTPKSVASEKAVQEDLADSNFENRILKARIVGGDNLGNMSEFPSKQVISDPFEGISGVGEGATTTPPYNLEQLVVLAESHPVHAAALEQKATDAIGSGPIWIPADDKSPDESQRDEIKEWLESLTENETFVELLNAAQLDYETVGWGTIEVARGADGKVKHLWHIPGHTVRAHRDNVRYVQARQGKAAWFKRWGAGLEDVPLLLANGRKAPKGTDYSKQANELLVLKKSSRRSTWYGIPNYVSAIGHIALAIAGRDYNVQFFSNAREPRLVFLVSGLDKKDVEEYLDELELSLRTQHKEPHRNLILPTTGKTQVKIERVTAIQNDMQFVKLMEQSERNILAAHRMPPDRLGVTTRGMLGGNGSASINRVYKDAVIGPSQLILKDRLNRFIRVEFARHKGLKPKEGESSPIRWKIDFESVDLSDETEDTTNAIAKIRANAITLNEGREIFGMPPRDGMDVTLSEWLTTNGVPVAMSAGDSDLDLRMSAMSKTQEAIMGRLEQLDEMITETLLSSGEEPSHGESEARAESS